MQGFLYLLFKPINTNQNWTKEEKQVLLKYLRRISLYVPVLIIFTLPGGSLMLPLLAEILDRRKTRRLTSPSSLPQIKNSGATSLGNEAQG